MKVVLRVQSSEPCSSQQCVTRLALCCGWWWGLHVVLCGESVYSVAVFLVVSLWIISRFFFFFINRVSLNIQDILKSASAGY